MTACTLQWPYSQSCRKPDCCLIIPCTHSELCDDRSCASFFIALPLLLPSAEARPVCAQTESSCTTACTLHSQTKWCRKRGSSKLATHWRRAQRWGLLSTSPLSKRCECCLSVTANTRAAQLHYLQTCGCRYTVTLFYFCRRPVSGAPTPDYLDNGKSGGLIKQFSGTSLKSMAIGNGLRRAVHNRLGDQSFHEDTTAGVFVQRRCSREVAHSSLQVSVRSSTVRCVLAIALRNVTW